MLMPRGLVKFSLTVPFFLGITEASYKAKQYWVLGPEYDHALGQICSAIGKGTWPRSQPPFETVQHDCVQLQETSDHPSFESPGLFCCASRYDTPFVFPIGDPPKYPLWSANSIMRTIVQTSPHPQLSSRTARITTRIPPSSPQSNTGDLHTKGNIVWILFYLRVIVNLPAAGTGAKPSWSVSYVPV
ncbi:hypothetical protein FRC14_001302 [Serendipita sp. 396]|nr:hypothetical protein FRC14_001302 [Serendipita sp. 396]KAG8774337.1 hypothetical protein FRC15_001359 [Serendipita sp. 397]KAG8815493.1 hypothetical protein FRC19_001006 [Serendipita sp. 401]KAG8815608.1 hypothetical protein FRC18_001419 [Serendipita sp. 400]